MKRSNRAQAGWLRTALFPVGFAAATAFAAPVDEELIGSDVSVHAPTLGMANATVSRARGVDALLTNPAGLGALSRSELALTTTYDGRQLESQLGRNDASSVSASAFRLGNLGFVYDADVPNGFGVGIAYRLVRNLDARSFVEGIETTGDYAGYDVTEDRETLGNVRALTLGLGAEVAPGTRLGVAVDLWDGERDRTILFVGNHPRTSDGFAFDDDYTRLISASRVKVGLELGVVPELTLGGTILFPSDVDIREDWQQLTTYRNADGTTNKDAQTGITDYALHLPVELRGGATLRLPPFRVSGELRYADWTSASYSPAPARDVDRRQFARYFDSTVETRIGAELELGNGAALRVGFIGDRIPATWYDVTVEPVTLTAGLTTPLAPGVLLDLAYLFTTWERENADVRETLTSHRFLVGARCVF
jgi:opacity protein-like surface antigen